MSKPTRLTFDSRDTGDGVPRPGDYIARLDWTGLRVWCGKPGDTCYGEFGPEFIPNPPHGMQVMPHGAAMSREQLDGRRGGRPIEFHFHAPVYGESEIERAINQALRQHSVALGRFTG